MLGEHAGDVVIDDDHLVDLAVPLLGEHADRGRAAADPHALFRDAVDDRRLAGLHDDRGAAVDREFDRLAVAEPSSASQVTRPSFLEPPVRWWTPPSDSICEPYSPVVTWPIGSPSRADGGALRAEIAVGVDLHLDAAIAENALGHDGDHVDAVDFRRHDERRRLVVGIGGAGADRRDELARPLTSSPSHSPRPERNHRAAMREGALEHVGIDANQFAIMVGVAVACARRPGLMKHMTGQASQRILSPPAIVASVMNKPAVEEASIQVQHLRGPIILFVHER